MPSRIYLSLVFHNHQPVGNFDHVFEEAYRKSYLPLVELLERHPKIHAGMHFTGCLRDWIVEHHPDLIKRVRALVERGQLEMLTGAYYEPILVALTDEDKIGQIHKLTQAIRDDFGYEPKGMWVAERVWEPHLPKPIAEAGVKYVIVDDTHFKNVGFQDEQLLGYYITEEQGHTLAVFPTLFKLRYTIPWAPVEEVIAWLREEAEKPLPGFRPKLAFMGDDGEKFGLWPTTYEHCWQNGYMDRLFEALEAESDWLITVTPTEYMEQYPPLGRAYLPTASYVEMTEWALPPEQSWALTHLRHQLEAEGRQDILRFLRGGIWRHFMVKYPEVNHMHKRSMSISAKVHAMPPGPKAEVAKSHLWASQCNCGYWHGVFGGVYLFHIRAANYANMITAEEIAEGDRASDLKIRAHDLDLDGNDEIELTGSPFAFIWTPAVGGAMIEWDYRPARYNILNVMTRHKEGYHRDLIEAAERGEVITPDMAGAKVESIHTSTVRAKEPGLEKLLFVDWYRRGAFIDHFLGEDATPENFYRSEYPEQGDFVNLPYRASWEGDERNLTVILSRDGNVWVGEELVPVRLEKRFRFRRGASDLHVEYTVTNMHPAPISVRFGVENAIGYDGGDGELCYLDVGGGRFGLGEVAAHEGVTAYEAGTHIRGFALLAEFDRPANLWRFPIEPVTISEAGFERVHQGTVLMAWWPLELAPGEAIQIGMRFEVRPLSSQ